MSEFYMGAENMPPLKIGYLIFIMPDDEETQDQLAELQQELLNEGKSLQEMGQTLLEELGVSGVMVGRTDDTITIEDIDGTLSTYPFEQMIGFAKPK
tara:strand:+ start:236 stop:526 length:291 start_codon:yes stop_codon:yes gene_type:complete